MDNEVEAKIRIMATPPNPNVADNFYGIYEVYSSSLDFERLDHERFKCRFCGETNKLKFTTKAHLIPEFTGNNDLISNFECDECNNKFSKYETSLRAFGGIRDSFTPIKKKNGGYPKFKDKKGGVELIYEKGTLEMKVKGLGSNVKLKDNKVIIEVTKQSYIPKFVLKSLVKIGIGLLKNEELMHFNKTIEWLRLQNDDFTETNHTLMVLYGNETRPPKAKPLAVLYRKKVVHNSPEFCLIFGYGFHIYQVFIPFSDHDNQLDLLNIYHPIESPHVAQRKNLQTYFEIENGIRTRKVKFTPSLNFLDMSSSEKKCNAKDYFESPVYKK